MFHVFIQVEAISSLRFLVMTRCNFRTLVAFPLSLGSGIVNSSLEKFPMNISADLREEEIVLRPAGDEAGNPCDGYTKTATSPYVVLILYKTAGRFVGMGSIIDKRTVLTSSQVVEYAMDYPPKLLVLAGRLQAYWGPGAQVTPAREIFAVETGLALISVRHDFIFNKYIAPIKIATTDAKKFHTDYGEAFAVYGIKRSGWDVPGEVISKASIYMRAIEANPTSEADCLNTYKDQDFSYDSMTCTHPTGSYTWGCIGSPTIGMTKGGDLLQVAVLFKATETDQEKYHFHVFVSLYEQWIKAHSLLGYQ